MATTPCGKSILPDNRLGSNIKQISQHLLQSGMMHLAPEELNGSTGDLTNGLISLYQGFWVCKEVWEVLQYKMLTCHHHQQIFFTESLKMTPTLRSLQQGMGISQHRPISTYFGRF